MNKIELEIVALSHSITQSHSYAVVLGEVNGLRRLPIVIGGFEAQAIAIALEKMKPARPLTHDLFTHFMYMFNIELEEVVINKLEEGIFHAKLVCLDANGDVFELDSRTSDALALAVRMNCRIYTYDNILDSAGLFLDQNESLELGEQPKKENPPGEFNPSKNDLKEMKLEELQDLLQKVLEQEDYVSAISIRDEINRRNKT